MESIYAISDIVALCSDAEGQPYLLLEAMRAGCAVVAMGVFGSAELIQHGKTGLLTESTPKSIAAAIDKLLVDKGKRDEYVENAYAYVCRCHSLEKQVSELTQIYESFVNKTQGQYVSAHTCTK
jgi:glycosyltransferase involved in cell wall biosynthesis